LDYGTRSCWLAVVAFEEVPISLPTSDNELENGKCGKALEGQRDLALWFSDFHRLFSSILPIAQLSFFPRLAGDLLAK